MVRRFMKHFNPCSGMERDVKDLHNLLEDAISIFSGRAQPARPESEKDWLIETETQLNYSDKLKDIVLDLITAFGFEVDENTLIDPSRKTWEKNKIEAMGKVKNPEEVLNRIKLPFTQQKKNARLLTSQEKAQAFDLMLWAYRNGEYALIYDIQGNCFRQGIPTIDDIMKLCGAECQEETIGLLKEQYFDKLRKESRELENG